MAASVTDKWVTLHLRHVTRPALVIKAVGEAVVVKVVSQRQYSSNARICYIYASQIRTVVHRYGSIGASGEFPFLATTPVAS